MATNIILSIVAGILLIVGIVGCFVPVLPGPPIAWVGLLAAYFSEFNNLHIAVLIITFLIAAGVTVLDFCTPSFMTKRTGGSKASTVCATIGTFIGFFIGNPIALILGPFVGAFIGELFNSKCKWEQSFKAAWGAFLGFLFGIGMKLITVFFFIWIYIFSFFVNK